MDGTRSELQLIVDHNKLKCHLLPFTEPANDISSTLVSIVKSDTAAHCELH